MPDTLRAILKGLERGFWFLVAVPLNFCAAVGMFVLAAVPGTEMFPHGEWFGKALSASFWVTAFCLLLAALGANAENASRYAIVTWRFQVAAASMLTVSTIGFFLAALLPAPCALCSAVRVPADFLIGFGVACFLNIVMVIRRGKPRVVASA